MTPQYLYWYHAKVIHSGKLFTVGPEINLSLVRMEWSGNIKRAKVSLIEFTFSCWQVSLSATQIVPEIQGCPRNLICLPETWKMCKDKLVLHLGVTLNNSSQIATWSRNDKMENPVTKAIYVWCRKCKRNPWLAQQDVSLMNSKHLCGSVALESAWLCIFLTHPAAAENHFYLRSFHKSITSS